MAEERIVGELEKILRVFEDVGAFMERIEDFRVISCLRRPIGPAVAAPLLGREPWRSAMQASSKPQPRRSATVSP
jgi:hypothetical protein